MTTQVPHVLMCPECRSADLRQVNDLKPLPAPFATTCGLRCQDCLREYPHVDGVWVMWSDNLKRLQFETPAEHEDVADRVRWANIQIYDQISDDYGEHSDGIYSYSQSLLFLKAIAGEWQQTNARERVLVDVGCATGVGLDVGSGSYTHCIGVDVSLTNLKAIAKKGYIAVLGDAECLPFQTNSVDMVTCFAALHHFPHPDKFIAQSQRCLREGGVLLTGSDPSRAFASFGPVAKLVWDLRKPVYRFLSRYFPRYYLHKDRAQQQINDLAEYQRTHGGFAPDELQTLLERAGFQEAKVFYGLDPDGHQKLAMPDAKIALLKTLSLQNPFAAKNWMSLSALARKPAANSTDSLVQAKSA